MRARAQHKATASSGPSLPATPDYPRIFKHSDFFPKVETETDTLKNIQERSFKFFLELRSSWELLDSKFANLLNDIKNHCRGATLTSNIIEDMSEMILSTNGFIKVCENIPHKEPDLHALNQSDDRLCSHLGVIMGKVRSRSLKYEEFKHLEALKADFLQCAKNFFSYDVTKYLVNCAPSKESNYRVKFPVLMQLVNNPKGVIYDVDDCLILSDEKQVEAWVRAIGLLAGEDKEGWDKKSPMGVRLMVECIQDCHRKNFTRDMLSRLHRIAVDHKFNFSIRDFDNQAGERVLESQLTKYRAEILVGMADRGKIPFTPGARENLLYTQRDRRKIGICTNSPQGTSEPLLRRLFQINRDLPEFDQLIPPEHRVYGDKTPIRKPSPIMWLIAASKMGLLPKDVAIFDNSLVNCQGAYNISPSDPELLNHRRGRLITNPKELYFAGVIGISNGFASVDAWKAWTSDLNRAEAPSNKTVRVLVSRLSDIYSEGKLPA